jgi:uncharacterized protein (UPF0276 family)
VISENFLGTSELPPRRLRRVAERYPVVAHGISLNLMGAEPLDLDYLARLKDLVHEHAIPWATDHLCWTASREVHHHDLLPAPYSRDLVPYVADRAAFVQDFLGVPFGIENLSAYVGFARDEMPEWEFYRAVVDQADCWFMLDINNVYVSSVNQRFDPREYLDAIRWDRVIQTHLAGHQVLSPTLLHDTHDREVSDPVWELYGDAWRRGGPFPTLVEWDADIPPLDVVLAQLEIARTVRAEASA